MHSCIAHGAAKLKTSVGSTGSDMSSSASVSGRALARWAAIGRSTDPNRREQLTARHVMSSAWAQRLLARLGPEGFTLGGLRRPPHRTVRLGLRVC